jgi:hypothetical protein
MEVARSQSAQRTFSPVTVKAHDIALEPSTDFIGVDFGYFTGSVINDQSSMR